MAGKVFRFAGLKAAPENEVTITCGSREAIMASLMSLALENHTPGRPPVPPDVQKEEFQRKVKDLEKKLYLAKKTIEVKELLSAYESFRASGTKKKEEVENLEETIRRVMEIIKDIKRRTGMPDAIIYENHDLG